MLECFSILSAVSLIESLNLDVWHKVFKRDVYSSAINLQSSSYESRWLSRSCFCVIYKGNESKIFRTLLNADSEKSENCLVDLFIKAQ